MADKLNVIVGAAAVFVGDAGAAKPAAVVAENYIETVQAASTDWTDVGYTQDGLEISYEPDYGGVEVDQALDEVRLYKNSMRVMLNTTFAEATLENLLFVWAQPDTTLAVPADTATTGNLQVLTIEGGALGQAPLERQIIAIGNGPEVAGVYKERVYHAERALSTDTSSHALRRSEATVFPVSWRLLPTDDPGAPYGTITDRNRV